MAGHLLFESGHAAERVVILDRRVGIFVTHGQNIPVVVAAAPARMDDLLAVRLQFDPASPIVSDEGGDDALLPSAPELFHHVSRRKPHTLQVGSEEAEIARPVEILAAPADEA